MKIGIIVQARMGSTRLPGKIMKDILGKPMLARVLERLKQVQGVDTVMVATTTLAEDDIVAEFAQSSQIPFYRGDAEDVLSRFYHAAQQESLDVIIRITADCPLIDPEVTGSMLAFYLAHDYDIVSNATVDIRHRTFPRGLDTEIFSFPHLENAHRHANLQSHREHVTLYIYENTERKFYFCQERDYSMYRWTVDTQEDFDLILAIYTHLYHGSNTFYQNEILQLFEHHPELKQINEQIKQKEVH